MKLREIFGLEYKGKNFMTPEVLRYGQKKLGEDRILVYELSRGPGFTDRFRYGVTVISYNPKTGKTRREPELNSLNFSLVGAERAIDKLKTVAEKFYWGME